MTEVFVNLDVQTLTHLQATAKSHVIIIKFTANWCGPCKRIKNLVESHFVNLPQNVIVFELDIDDPVNLPIYTTLKAKRQLKGIPGIIAYYNNINRPAWYLPDACVNSANVNSINHFFQTVIQNANILLNASRVANANANGNANPSADNIELNNVNK